MNLDLLKNISLFINYKHIWYLVIFNKKISYDDNYWNYRAKNIYNCNKIINKKIMNHIMKHFSKMIIMKI